jgi:hypothetical protein
MGGMADKESSSGRLGFAQTLREGWKPPQRRSKTTEAPTEEQMSSKASEPVTKTTTEAAATKSTNGAETKSAAAGAGAAAAEKPSTTPAATEPATGPAAGPKTADPNLSERMEGLQGWMAEIERKQRRMTFFGAVAVALAALAAAAGLYLAITTPNSASKDDFDDLEAQVEVLQGQVTQATTDQNRLKALNASIQDLATRVAASEQKANQQASEIAAVKAQAQAAQQAAATATPAPTPAPITPTPAPGDTKP